MIVRLRNESGQALVVTAVFMVVLLGGTALTLDVGSWYREHRQAQTTADAAALAGAQSLPGDTSGATTVAQTYADKNGGGVVATGGIAFRSDFEANDTVTVKVQRVAPGFFSKLFGVDSTTVHAAATARSAVPIDVRGAAPIVVNKNHQYLTGHDTSGNLCPCFGPLEPTSIPLDKNGAPGAFDLVDLSSWDPTDGSGNCPRGGGGGNQGSSTLGDWIQNGYGGYLQLGCYDSDPGAKFNSSNIGDAMTARTGSVLLFPVYDALTGNGSGAQYRIIGWAAFHVSDFSSHGNSGEVDGYFTQVIWDGIQSTTAPTVPDFGVHSIALIN